MGVRPFRYLRGTKLDFKTIDLESRLRHEQVKCVVMNLWVNEDGIKVETWRRFTMKKEGSRMKNLSARIAEKAQLQIPDQKAKNRAAFLAHRDEIRQALEDHWSVKIIWRTLRDEGKIAFSYQAFIGYVKRLITNPPPTPSELTRTMANKRPRHHGFKFDAVPKKDELL